jgi:prolyl-tRNA synthetase
VPGREGKSFVPQEGLTARILALLDEIQQGLFARALRFREDHTADVTSYDELKAQIERGFARAYWDGSTDDEKRIQDETRATIRCIPLDQPGTAGTCVYTGRETTQQVIFARAY